MRFGLSTLRVVAGALFAGHGAQKLFGMFGGGGPDGTGQFFEMLGLRPGRQMAQAAGAAEFGGGTLLAAGLATPLAASALTGTMATALWTAHKDNGPWITENGYEYTLVNIALLFALTDAGPGKLSLDHALGRERKGLGWALLQLGAGLGGSALVISKARGEPAGSGPIQAASG